MQLSAAHIPGTQNIKIDSFSKIFSEAVGRKLSTQSLQKISKYIWKPNIRSFRLPHKLPKWQVYFFETRPQSHRNVFSIKWNTECYYIFLPFSLLGKVTAKIYRDKTKAIVVIPKWPTQHWYPSLLRKVTGGMAITLSAKDLVQPQDPQKVFPLHQKLYLQVLLIN